MSKVAVVALGGNAILRRGDRGTITEQFARTRQSLVGIVELIRDGYRLAITHGNGPQAGNELLRVERARDLVPELPLGIIDAGTEGWMGYMIQQSLGNRLHWEGISRRVVTIPTQVIVDPNDPEFATPTKPIGPFYDEAHAKQLQAQGVLVHEDAGRGFRRVVPSPNPLEIVEKETIAELVAAGVVVIAAGGGGIPVYRREDGSLEGVDAVIDKDLASAVLARDIHAETLLILTNVDRVYLDFGTLQQRGVERMNISEAEGYLSEGQFPSGSMGPKVRAAIDFIESGGSQVIITSLELARESLVGKAGTRILP